MRTQDTRVGNDQMENAPIAIREIEPSDREWVRSFSLVDIGGCPIEDEIEFELLL
jgi:hypothetical protein